MMTAWLKRNVDRCPNGHCAGGTQRLNFGMVGTRSLVPTTPNNLAVAYNDATYPRIRRRCFQPQFC